LGCASAGFSGLEEVSKLVHQVIEPVALGGGPVVSGGGVPGSLGGVSEPRILSGVVHEAKSGAVPPVGSLGRVVSPWSVTSVVSPPWR